MPQEPSFFTVIPMFIVSDDRMSSTSKILYGLISSLARKDGYCFASDRFLARFVAKKARSIQDNLRELEACGFISRDVKYQEKIDKFGEKRMRAIRRIFLTINNERKPSEKDFVLPPEDPEDEDFEDQIDFTPPPSKNYQDSSPRQQADLTSSVVGVDGKINQSDTEKSVHNNIDYNNPFRWGDDNSGCPTDNPHCVTSAHVNLISPEVKKTCPSKMKPSTPISADQNGAPCASPPEEKLNGAGAAAWDFWRAIESSIGNRKNRPASIVAYYMGLKAELSIPFVDRDAFHEEFKKHLKPAKEIIISVNGLYDVNDYAQFFEREDEDIVSYVVPKAIDYVAEQWKKKFSWKGKGEELGWTLWNVLSVIRSGEWKETSRSRL